MAVNIKPEKFGTYYDPEYNVDIEQPYSYTPGNVGRMGYVGGDGFENPGEYKWIPSRFDFSDAKYKVNKFGQHEYTMPDGSKVSYNVQNDTVESYIPSNLGKARADVVHSYNGNLLGNPFTYLQPENLTFQGQKVQRGEDVGDTFFLVNPNTYEYVKDAEGNYVLPYDYGSGNGFTNFMTDNGWMLPLAMGAGAAAGAAGLIGGAAEAGAAVGTSTGTGLTGGAGGSTGLLGGGTVGTISAPTSAGALGLNAAAESAIATGAGAGLSTGASSFAPAGVGGLNAALPAAGSVGGAGSMSAALPAGTIIGDGTLGTTIGASYAASTPGQFALDALGNAIPASSVGIGSLGGVSGGYDLLSNLGNALKGAQVAKGLLGAGKNPAVQPMGVQPMQSQQRQYAGVDYSPILNLLALKSPERNKNSLLG